MTNPQLKLTVGLTVSNEYGSYQVVRVLNDEAPEWATHGVVVLFDSTGGNSAEGECEDALVTWCTSEAEMWRTWDLCRAFRDQLTDEPAIKALDDLPGTQYALAVDEEGASIRWEPKPR